jgi:hypothetical protein
MAVRTAMIQKTLDFIGGADQDRTDDLLNAIQAKNLTSKHNPAVPLKKSGGLK